MAGPEVADRTDYRHGHQFLTIGAAAKVLGVSTLRVRDAVARGILPARRDNRGELRVDLIDRPDLSTMKPASGPALVDALFDEVEALQGALAVREERDGRLAALLARQDRALSRALDLMEGGGGAAGGSASAVGAQLESVQRQNARLTALLDRALDALEIAAGPEAAELTSQRLRDAATGVVEDDRRRTAPGEGDERLETLLERALAGAERLERELAARDRSLAERDAALEQVLSLSERSLAAATSKADASAKVGFWRRMFGRS